MTQQRRAVSVLEISLSTALGFGVALVTNLTVLPLFNLHASMGSTLWITVIFTAVSVVRGYLVRRLFVWLHNQGILR